jgi:hypothetical protein
VMGLMMEQHPSKKTRETVLISFEHGTCTTELTIPSVSQG